MRNLFYIWLALIVAVVWGCASSSKTKPQAQAIPNTQAWWPKVLESGSHGQIQSAGKADALADIANGHPRICHTGTIAAFPVGVPEKYLNEVGKLPIVPLPSGCTEPLVGAATIYAKAYNTEIVHYLESKPN